MPYSLPRAHHSGAFKPVWSTTVCSQGYTSAAFNEVDRHVLSGHGDETAFISVGALCSSSAPPIGADDPFWPLFSPLLPSTYGRWCFRVPQVGPAAFEAALAGAPVVDECTKISRKELLAASALNAVLLKEAGLSKGDTLLLLLPHCIEQLCWIEAAKRLGVIYLCLPESISVPMLAGRLFDTAAKLVITSAAKSSVEGTSHKAMVSHAVMECVSTGNRSVRRGWPLMAGPLLSAVDGI